MARFRNASAPYTLMKHSEYLVTIPPDEVIARLSGVIETSWKRSLVGVGNQKKYLGSINGRQFWFRVWRASRNSFAPTCSGQVIQAGDGSKIVAKVGAHYGCLYAFGGLFVLIVSFLSLILFWLSHDPEVAAKWAKQGFPGQAAALFPLGFVAVLVIVFVLLRLKSGTDELQLQSLLPSLFSDVLVRPPGAMESKK